jgi:hypothetical protein
MPFPVSPLSIAQVCNPPAETSVASVKLATCTGNGELANESPPGVPSPLPQLLPPMRRHSATPSATHCHEREPIDHPPPPKNLTDPGDFLAFS